jgi:hypothetical protein
VRSLVSSLTKSKANAASDEWTATLEFKAILEILFQLLELHDTAAVVNSSKFQPIADGPVGLSPLGVMLV